MTKLLPMATRRTLAAVLVLAAAAALSALDLAQLDDDTRSPGRNVPGDFDYYTLVLSWSPTHCASSDGEDDIQQCGRRDGRRYAFVLHGLWPQYEQGYPESCRTKRRPYVPEAVIDGMTDIMPSKRLIIHEYRLHGTCSGLDPQGYYRLSRQLFEMIEIPDRYRNPFEAQFVGPDELIDELVEHNPGLEPDMVAVTCGSPGNRLRDVRICLTKDGAFRTCGDNEDQQRLCRAAKMHVPPVRSAKTGPMSSEEREQGVPPQLPQPRVIEMQPRP